MIQRIINLIFFFFHPQPQPPYQHLQGAPGKIRLESAGPHRGRQGGEGLSQEDRHLPIGREEPTLHGLQDPWDGSL